MNKNKNLQVLDANGKPIVCGSIVGMKEDGSFSDFQGFVVAPHSEKEGDGYTVAVFFGTEVASFWISPMSDIDEWDRKYKDKLKINEWNFLLQDDVWQNCPRVRFFQPKELVVQEGWSIETLAERFFHRGYHSLFYLPKGVSSIPTSYMCFMKECTETATQIAVYNVWGSVYPMHVCDKCFKETNGWRGDDLPKMKEVHLLAKDSPVYK